MEGRGPSRTPSPFPVRSRERLHPESGSSLGPPPCPTRVPSSPHGPAAAPGSGCVPTVQGKYLPFARRPLRKTPSTERPSPLRLGPPPLPSPWYSESAAGLTPAGISVTSCSHPEAATAQFTRRPEFPGRQPTPLPPLLRQTAPPWKPERPSGGAHPLPSWTGVWTGAAPSCSHRCSLDSSHRVRRVLSWG